MPVLLHELLHAESWDPQREKRNTAPRRSPCGQVCARVSILAWNFAPDAERLGARHSLPSVPPPSGGGMSLRSLLVILFRSPQQSCSNPGPAMPGAKCCHRIKTVTSLRLQLIVRSRPMHRAVFFEIAKLISRKMHFLDWLVVTADKILIAYCAFRILIGNYK